MGWVKMIDLYYSAFSYKTRIWKTIHSWASISYIWSSNGYKMNIYMEILPQLKNMLWLVVMFHYILKPIWQTSGFTAICIECRYQPSKSLCIYNMCNVIPFQLFFIKKCRGIGATHSVWLWPVCPVAWAWVWGTLPSLCPLPAPCRDGEYTWRWVNKTGMRHEERKGKREGRRESEWKNGRNES